MRQLRTFIKGWLQPGQANQPPSSDWQKIIQDYTTAAASEKQVQQWRLDFLQAVVHDIALLHDETAARFLAEQIVAEDLTALSWESTEAILSFCNRLYTFPFADVELRKAVRDHIHALLRHVLHTYETAGNYERLFTGAQIMPTYVSWDDEELKRLRHLAYRYEYRRVSRNRRVLYAYLVIQAVLIVLLFPYLLINAENGALQARVEELTDVQIGDEGYQLLSYNDALYWAIITATSIGYGDITPTTATGRIIAAILGTMGVITVGIITGLILDWITPRRLD